MPILNINTFNCIWKSIAPSSGIWFNINFILSISRGVANKLICECIGISIESGTWWKENFDIGVIGWIDFLEFDDISLSFNITVDFNSSSTKILLSKSYTVFKFSFE